MTQAPRRGRKPKSNFYHIRWNKVKINERVAAEILGVTVEDVLRFDDEGAPPMAEKLLLLWDRKHIGYEGWSRWLFSRDRLLYKGQIFTPEGILRDRQDALKLFRLECYSNELMQKTFTL